MDYKKLKKEILDMTCVEHCTGDESSCQCDTCGMHEIVKMLDEKAEVSE